MGCVQGINDELGEERRRKLYETEKRRLDQFLKLASALPQTGQPARLPSPAWQDQRSKDIDRTDNDIK